MLKHPQPQSSDPIRPQSLDERSAHEWRLLAEQVVDSRAGPHCSGTNVTLQAAADREPQSPAAPAYWLWISDNLARDRRFSEALRSYDSAVVCARGAQPLLATVDAAASALHHKAQTAALANDLSAAIAAYTDLSKLRPGDADPMFQAGLLAEGSRPRADAADYYRKAAAERPTARTDDPAELARRSLARLDAPDSDFAPEARQVVDRLLAALGRRDVEELRRLVSKTHFAVGPVGGHTMFETDDVLEELYRDLKRSNVVARPQLLGSGGKLYLATRGWRGTWFRGEVLLLINRAPRGWQWTGMGVAAAGDVWADRWRPAAIMTNQPLPFELLAPWPADRCFTAGGLTEYIIQQAGLGLLGALFLSRSRCGFGPRGFYYNQGSTHDEEDAFAIDFTRYQRYAPYVPRSGGTPVLAARAGIVVRATAGTPSGSDTASNTVEIEHADPANPADLSRFRSRYLHLEGPNRLDVSELMPVLAGRRLGFMDDTGNSVLNHLHFSIHDRQIPHPNASYGASVRPTPMSGAQLEDGDSGRCVCSTNIMHVGEKTMIEATSFAGQNWLISPAALATSETPPARIQDQKWWVVLSGVVIVDLKGSSSAAWRRETVSIRPDLNAPLTFAVERYGIPTPPGENGANYWTALQVEQWAPFAALSSMFNQQHSVNSGFAVDVWRPNPFASGPDSFSSATHENLFAGIQVDVAVRDVDAWLYRLSYNIVLLGKIVFGPIIIT